MSYQIVQNVMRKGDPSLKKKKVRKSISYLAVPFKEMRINDCIIMRSDVEGEPLVRNSAKAAIRQGVKRALKLLGLTDENYIVDWTSDKQHIGLWRIK